MSSEEQTNLLKPTSLKLRPLGVFLGAEVTGIDLSKPLNKKTLLAISRAHAEYGFLVFPNQPMSSKNLKTFGKYFGKLTVHPFSSSTEKEPEVIIYDQKEGNPPPPTDIWHTDETFRERPPMATALCSKIIPQIGGNTAFVSMAAIYDGLSDRLQSFLTGLEAVHDFKPFRTLFATDRKGIERVRKFEDLYPPVTHPVITVHPVTKRKVLFVNPQFTLYIKGMEEDESRTILNLLFRKTNIHEYQYRHQWQENMLLFWDNRSVQHSALHDYYPKRRMMERVTIQGKRPVGPGKAAKPSEVRRYLSPPVMTFKSRQKRQHEM